MVDDGWLDDFAIRSFRDEGDAAYIAARMAFRAALVTPLGEVNRPLRNT